MRARPPERFVVNRLPCRPLHQVGPAQSHERSSLDHDYDVRESREISATCDTWSHDRCDLRHFQIASHDRVVIEDARGAILAGKDSVLVRQIHAGGIDEVDNGHMLAHRNFLGPQNLFDRFGPP